MLQNETHYNYNKIFETPMIYKIWIYKISIIKTRTEDMS